MSASSNAMVARRRQYLRCLSALGCRPSDQRFQAFVSSCAREVFANSLGGVLFLMQHVTHAWKLHIHLSTTRATDTHFFFTSDREYRSCTDLSLSLSLSAVGAMSIKKRVWEESDLHQLIPYWSYGINKMQWDLLASLLASNLVRCCRLELLRLRAYCVRVVAWWLAGCGCECSRNKTTVSRD